MANAKGLKPFDWGIVAGVADDTIMPFDDGSNSILIGTVKAIDKAGRELLIREPIKYALDPDILRPNADIYVTLQYRADSDMVDSPWGKADKAGLIQPPHVAATLTRPPNDGSVILLARLHLDANGRIAAIDESVRTLARRR